MDAVQQGGALGRRIPEQHSRAPSRLRFRYLASPNQDFDATAFDYNVGAAIMEATKTLSQYIVVDTGLAMAGATIAAADASDIIFLVTSRDVARLLSTKNMIKFLKNDRQVTNQKLKVLVNEAEIGAEISESEIESLLEHPVAAYLPCNAGADYLFDQQRRAHRHRGAPPSGFGRFEQAGRAFLLSLAGQTDRRDERSQDDPPPAFSVPSPPKRWLCAK